MKTIRDFSLQGKRVLVRCDFNIPLGERGDVLNDFRIVQSLPTIKYLVQEKARVILMSHLGKPEGQVVEKLKMYFVQESLVKYLGKIVAKAKDCVGQEVKDLVSDLQGGDVLLLENLRFHAEEEGNDENFAKELASLGELYINDAFSASHRNHASVAGVAKFLPSGIGLLMEKELSHLEKFSRKPKRPFVVIVGGAKVKDKLAFIDAISKAADWVLLGNLIAKEAIAEGIAFQYPKKIVFPQDGVPGNGVEYDIGPKTRQLFVEKIKGAKSVFWTGPLGWVSKKEYAEGSLAIASAIVERKAFSVAGGGNLSAFLGEQGFQEKFSHVSTGGGAALAFLAGKRLPGLEALGYYEEGYGNQKSSKGGFETQAGN